MLDLLSSKNGLLASSEFQCMLKILLLEVEGGEKQLHGQVPDKSSSFWSIGIGLQESLNHIESY